MTLQYLEDRSHDVLYYCYRGLARCVSHYDIDVRGPRPPKDAIIAATHSSRLDGLALVLGLNRKIVFPTPAYSSIPVGRINTRNGVTRENLATMGRFLARGYSLGIFPQGGIDKEGTIGHVYKGAFFLARHFERPVVPVAIKGTQGIWPFGRKFPRSPLGKIVLQCGEPLEYKCYKGKMWAPLLTDQLRDLYARTL